MTRIRVMIVDDHPCVVQGLLAYPKTVSEISVVGLAMSGVDVIRKAKPLNPDVILMDSSLPRLDGIEAIKVIHADLPRAGVIAYTMHESREIVRQVTAAGARGCVLKSSPLTVGMKAIKRLKSQWESLSF